MLAIQVETAYRTNTNEFIPKLNHQGYHLRKPTVNVGDSIINSIIKEIISKRNISFFFYKYYYTTISKLKIRITRHQKIVAAPGNNKKCKV